MKKLDYRKILKLLSWTSMMVFFVLITVGAIEHEEHKICKKLIVKIDQDLDNHFLDELDIKNELLMEQSNIVGRKTNRIDFKRIENGINKNDFIENTEIMKTVNGDVIIEVEQKNPILRVMNYKGMSYYVSDKWKWMPSSTKFTKRTMTITGYVNDITQAKNTRDSLLIFEIKTLTNFILKDEFWRDMIAGIHINEAGKIELIPVLEDFKIKFGAVDEGMELKFKKLELFYREGLKYADGTQYQYIDISYRDQILGIKKEIQL